MIGLNGSGKSNLIEVLSLLQASPKDFLVPIRQGGGVREWLYKGSDIAPIAEINAVVDYPDGSMPLRYKSAFTMVGQRLEMYDEAVEDERPLRGEEDDVYFYYRYQRGNPVVNIQTSHSESADQAPERTRRFLRRQDLDPEQSVLSQRKDPDQDPELTYLADSFSKMKFYREWNQGRLSPARLPQKTDLPADFLLEDASNLGLVLNNLQHHPSIKKRIVERLRKIYEPVEEIDINVYGGTVQLFFHETDLLQPVPATRLSDGTIRFLCLLTILLHPSPPPVICLEEPELGLHPDALSTVADLLKEASKRTQLFVTTHSDLLVSELSDVPESVLVCERDPDGTYFRRLEKDKLQDWLEKYSLGGLWLMGELGGTR
ncbi:MAG: AAA family ATPase [Deltaproteobacteria bacterium]|nr:AAA family ATPase [Deltaproteobacteria bacterium]